MNVRQLRGYLLRFFGLFHRVRSLRSGGKPRKSRDKLHLQSRSVSVAI
jgi:hypothetical protein